MKELDREVYELSNDIAQIEAVILINSRRIKEQTSSTVEKSDKCKDEKTNGAMDVDMPSNARSPIDVLQLQQDIDQLLRDRALLCSVARQKIHDKKAIARSLIEMINQFEHKLDSDLAHFEQDLKMSGDYEAPPGIPPNSEVRYYIEVEHCFPINLSYDIVWVCLFVQVAVKLTIDSQDKTLILAQVRLFRSEINSYEIIDVDDQQKYTLPDSQVFELGQADILKKIAKGDHVYALYPDTTIFYPATVLSAPKRISTSSSNLSSLTTVDMYTLPVQFHGDEDHDGNIPLRSIPLKYVVRAPQFM